MHRLTDSYPRLLADIGGTNARFGWQAAPGRGAAHAVELGGGQQREAQLVEVGVGRQHAPAPSQEKPKMTDIVETIDAGRIAGDARKAEQERAGAILAIGKLVVEAQQAAELLAASGIEATVWDVRSCIPLDPDRTESQDELRAKYERLVAAGVAKAAG